MFIVYNDLLLVMYNWFIYFIIYYMLMLFIPLNYNYIIYTIKQHLINEIKAFTTKYTIINFLAIIFRQIM